MITMIWMHQVFMLPPEHSVLRHFKRGNTLEICDRVMFDFYRWLSHVCSMFQIILSQSCFNFTGTWALCNHVFLGSIKSLKYCLSSFLRWWSLLLAYLYLPIFTIVGDLNNLLAWKSAFYKFRLSTKGLWSIKWGFWFNQDRNVQRKSLQLVALTAIHSNPFSLQNFPFKDCYLERKFWCVSLSLSTPWCSKHYAIPRAKYPFSIESLLEHPQLGVANPRLAWTQAEALQVLVWFPVN